MASSIEILGTPSSLNNTAWSEDCDLAVSLTEHVEIFVPRLGFSPPSRYELEDTRWHRIRLQVNRFTREEVPYVNPLSFRAFSFGEEQTLSHIVALAWSPSGVGKHGRCALAVLTANHVLSIWAPIGDARESSGWRRVLVVNHIVKQLLRENNRPRRSTDESAPEQNGSSQNGKKEPSMGASDDEYSAEETREEYKRLRLRVRSFCWSPRLFPQAKASNTQGKQISHQYLAMSNDLGEIFVLEIKPSHSHSQSSSTSWSSTIVAYRDVCNLVEDPIPFDQFSNSPLEATNFALNLSWSPFLYATGANDDESSSVLAYTLGSRLVLAICKSFENEQETEMGFSSEKADFGNEYPGPLSWTYDIQMDAIHLLAFTREEAHCISLPSAALKAKDGKPSVMLSARLKGDSWYPIAGYCFTKGSGTNADGLHFMSSFTTDSFRKQHGMSWPFLETSNTFETTWSEAMVQQRLLFDSQHEIDEKVAAKVHGMASSPLGDCIAMCVSLHPAQMPEYRSARSPYVSLLLAFENESLEPLLEALRSMNGHADPTYEALMFSAQRFLSDAPIENPQDGAADLRIVLNSKASKLRQSGTKSVRKKNTSGREDFLNDLGARLGGFDGFSRRVIHVFAPEENHDLRRQQETFDEGVASRMTSDILALPRNDLQVTNLTQLILKLYEQCQELVITQTRNSQNSRRECVDLNPSENCVVCEALLPFESMNWARCGNEHQFTRCSLTFIAIQEPGVSKFCGICGRQYLSEHHLLSVDTRAGEERSTSEPSDESRTPVKSAQNTISLVEILVSSLDVCVYCGVAVHATASFTKSILSLLLSMDTGSLTRKSFGPRRSKGRDDLRISISSSTARQSAQIVPSPSSPARSITDAIMETSQPSVFENIPRDEDWSTDESGMPEINIEPPQRHPQHRYREHQKSSTREKSYFKNDSDSSDTDTRHREGSAAESVSSQSFKATENTTFPASRYGSIGIAQSSVGEQTGSRSLGLDKGELEHSDAGEPFKLNPEHSMLTGPLYSYGTVPTYQSYAHGSDTVNPFENTHRHPDSYGNRDLSATHPASSQSGSNQPSEAKNAFDKIIRMSALSIHEIKDLTRMAFDQLDNVEQKSETSKSKPQTPRTSNEFGSSRASSLRTSRRSNTFLRSGADTSVPAIESANNSMSSSIQAKRRSLSSPPAPEAPPVPPLPEKLQFAEGTALGPQDPHSYTTNGPLRTPYPFPPGGHNSFKNSQERRQTLRRAGPPRDLREVSRSGVPPSRSMISTHTLLVLWVRRRNYPNGRNVAFVAVPADPELAKPRRPRRDTPSPDMANHGAGEHSDGAAATAPQPALDFDDAKFFQCLREAYYRELLGQKWFARTWRRFFSALELKRIKLSTGDARWSSDRVDSEPLQSSHLSDIENQQEHPRWYGGADSNIAGPGASHFSEKKLMRFFKHPPSEKARYTWVHWIHRVALELEKEENDAAVTAARKKEQKARPTRSSSMFGRRPSQSRSRSRSRSASLSRSMSLGRKKGKSGDGKSGVEHKQAQRSSEKSSIFHLHKEQQQPNGLPTDPQMPAAATPRKFSQAPFQMQFIEGFSKLRIMIGVLSAFGSVVVILLLWVLIGPGRSSAQGRVASGAGLGLVTGAFGVLGLGLWVLVSWLAMS